MAAAAMPRLLPAATNDHAFMRNQVRFIRCPQRSGTAIPQRFPELTTKEDAGAYKVRNKVSTSSATPTCAIFFPAASAGHRGQLLLREAMSRKLFRVLRHFAAPLVPRLQRLPLQARTREGRSFRTGKPRRCRGKKCHQNVSIRHVTRSRAFARCSAGQSDLGRVVVPL